MCSKSRIKIIIKHKVKYGVFVDLHITEENINNTDVFSKEPASLRQKLTFRQLQGFICTKRPAVQITVVYRLCPQAVTIRTAGCTAGMPLSHLSVTVCGRS